MKKNIEWLKEDFDRIMNLNIHTNPVNEWKKGFNYGWIEARNNVRHLINQLDEPEVLSQEWINEHKHYYPVTAFNNSAKEIVDVEDLQNLLVPKQELPVIPRFVADWYEKHKDNLEGQLQGIAYNLNKYGTMTVLNKVDGWINKTEKPLQTVASLSFGYEVEEEQKYFAKIKGHENIGSDDKYWNYCITDESLDIGDNKIHADVLAEYVLNATKDEWENLGINDDNADFIKVEELEEWQKK